jgi:IgA Peptidase M64
MLKYSTDVDNLVKAIFAQSPYADYAPYFNIFRIDVTSKESGADHPERGVFRDTAFGAAYNCGGVQRLICINSTAVSDALSRNIPAADRDLVIILVNDSEYGGSGGRYAVASTHPLVAELMLHEAGHTLGLLGDEYEGPDSCGDPKVEPASANITRETTRDAIKWKYWIDPQTNVPTGGQAPATPGLYAGGGNCTGTMFRPTWDSKMRSLSRPFEQINTEQLIKRFYNFVSPIDVVFPSAPSLTIRIGDALGFAIDRPRPVRKDLVVEWTVDGVVAGRADGLTVDTATLAPGRHAVDVTVHDPTTSVAWDPKEALTERFHWNVEIIP